VSEEYYKRPSYEKLASRLRFEIAMHRIQCGWLLGTIAKFRQYIIYCLLKETLQKLANICLREQITNKQNFKQHYESINCIVFTQFVVERCDASLVKKQTG